jgi:mono/diheme cytochrome c family protein
MKKAFKVLSLVTGIITLVMVLVLVYLNVTYPRSDAPENIKIKPDLQRLQRGRYLSTNVAGCIGCHSIRDWTRFGAPPKPGTEGGGGDQINENNGFPGTVIVKNITPFSLVSWSDGELIRAIACGVTPENEPLFPIMPYADYNTMSREDMYSIITYLKALEPIENDLGETELNFPINFIARTVPLKSYTPVKELQPSDTLRYGKYLTTIASCFGCHTRMERGQYAEGMDYAGGREFKISSGVVRSSNITPSSESGIGGWNKEIFVRRFKYFDTDSTRNVTVGHQDFNTPMPWTMYAGMTEEDLGAIFEYLKTLKPVDNRVLKWSPAHVTK